MNLKDLIGSGDKIGKAVLPVLVIGLILNLLYPSLFAVGGPSPLLKNVSLIILLIGLVNWLWCAILILTYIPKKRLITTGPYAVVKHPLYAGVALLVLPWIGFLFNSWLGMLLGIVLYLATRKYALEEETVLSKTFGKEWNKYSQQVLIPWL